MPTRIDVLPQEQLQRIVMQNHAIRAVVLPELGGKIGSLVSLGSGREFFLQHPDRPYRRARYAASIGDYDIGGFDECLPTVSECLYPDPPFAGVVMPDHGEVWSRPWRYEIQGEELDLEVEGVRLPYLLRRKIRLTDSALELEYEITNIGTQPFKYLWSAHPLLSVESGGRDRFARGYFGSAGGLLGGQSPRSWQKQYVATCIRDRRKFRAAEHYFWPPAKNRRQIVYSAPNPGLLRAATSKHR